MDLYALSDEELLRELGGRIKRHRLVQNLTQGDIAEAAGLNRTTVVSLEAGNHPKLLTVVQVLRALDALDDLNNFLPEPGLSPLKLLELKGKERRRASRSSSPSENEGSEW